MAAQTNWLLELTEEDLAACLPGEGDMAETAETTAETGGDTYPGSAGDTRGVYLCPYQGCGAVVSGRRSWRNHKRRHRRSIGAISRRQQQQRPEEVTNATEEGDTASPPALPDLSLGDSLSLPSPVPCHPGLRNPAEAGTALPDWRLPRDCLEAGPIGPTTAEPGASSPPKSPSCPDPTRRGIEDDHASAVAVHQPKTYSPAADDDTSDGPSPPATVTSVGSQTAARPILTLPILLPGSREAARIWLQDLQRIRGKIQRTEALLSRKFNW